MLLDEFLKAVALEKVSVYGLVCEGESLLCVHVCMYLCAYASIYLRICGFREGIIVWFVREGVYYVALYVCMYLCVNVPVYLCIKVAVYVGFSFREGSR